MIDLLFRLLDHLNGSAARERALRAEVHRLERAHDRLEHAHDQLLDTNVWQAQVLQRVNQAVPGVVAGIIEEGDLRGGA